MLIPLLSCVLLALFYSDKLTLGGGGNRSEESCTASFEASRASIINPDIRVNDCTKHDDCGDKPASGDILLLIAILLSITSTLLLPQNMEVWHTG